MATPIGTDSHARHNVLVVDDYTDTRDAIVGMLQAKGFDVGGAPSGPDALDMLQAGLRPCVMLLDVRMPGMDGWEVWERLRAHRELAQTAVVILSAEAADSARAQRVGIREFLRKPVHGLELVSAVERHCNRRES